MSSIRDKILGQKAKVKVINVAGWDFPVRLQEMTVARRMSFFEILEANAAAIREAKADSTKPAVEPVDEVLLGIVHTIVDDENELVFKVTEMDLLKELPYSSLQTIWREAMHLSYMSSILEEIEAEKKD